MMAFQAEMKRDPAKRASPFTPEDFMPKAAKPKTVQTGMGPDVFFAFEKVFNDG